MYNQLIFRKNDVQLGQLPKIVMFLIFTIFGVHSYFVGRSRGLHGKCVENPPTKRKPFGQQMTIFVKKYDFWSKNNDSGIPGKKKKVLIQNINWLYS